MKEIQLLPKDFFNFQQLAKKTKEIYDYVTHNGVIYIEASINFLTEYGYE